MRFFAQAFGFFNWVGISHFINLLFISLLIRSGLEILSAHPKLYWNDDCRVGSEWLKFTRKVMPTDRLWTASDEQEPFSSWLALPGHMNLGMGRHWHFFSVIFWMLNGVVYVLLLFTIGGWRRLIPTSWSIVPAAMQTAWTYAHFHLPPPGHPYNPIQQLAYAGVVFVLAPLMIATGAAMSPAVAARFPGYIRMMGGRQSARSMHFLGLIAIGVFTVVHVTLVVIEDFSANMSYIIHGEHALEGLSVAIGIGGLIVVAILHVWATRVSLSDPKFVQRALGIAIEPVRRRLLHHLGSRQAYPRSAVSAYFRVNGVPPESAEYQQMARTNFENWRLEVGGLVENRLQLTLADVRAMRAQSQITLHHCIQGWSGIAQWTGVAMTDILARCRPLARARYLVLRSWQEPEPGVTYYEVIDLELAHHAQTILAYAMNGAPLQIPHGAPCRLRVETQLGFKMVKWVRSIELVEDYRMLGAGQGGYREDVQFYGPEAGI
jgi:DMSO/TMAO reductase YedYZ molybdopterin-dependent catalytic subunit/thiosulfate reductase cytochrome b subunit